MLASSIKINYYYITNHSLLFPSVASKRSVVETRTNKETFGGGFPVYTIYVFAVVCDLDSQSQPSLSSSKDNVSVSGQSNRVLSDL